MATSTPGVGSGLDVNAIVNQLVAVERQPLQKLQQRATVIQAQVSSWGKVKAQLDALNTAAAKLARAATWTQSGVTSTDPTAVGASLASTGTASPGRYSVQVSQLAQEQSLASTSISSGSDLRGRLTIELGTFGSGTPPSFTPRSGTTAVHLDFIQADTTLSDVRDAINAANAGVLASVLNDGAGERLVLSGTETGADRGFRLTVSAPSGAGTTGPTAQPNGAATTVPAAQPSTSSATSSLIGGAGGLLALPGSETGANQGSDPSVANPSGTGTTGLSALAYDGSASSPMTLTRQARNASFTINGVAMSSPSNTLDGTVQGLRLQLLKAGSTTDVIVETDTASQKKALEDFVTAYNAVNSQIAGDTNYDAVTKKAGPLFGDAGALAVRRALRDMIGQSSTASTVFTRLSDLGMDIKRDGSISIGATALGNALAKPIELGKLMSAAGSGTHESKGLAVRLKALIDPMLSSDGLVDSRSESLRDRLKRNQSDQDRLTDRVEATKQRLLRVYQSLDGRIAQLNGLGNYVAQQFGNRR